MWYYHIACGMSTKRISPELPNFDAGQNSDKSVDLKGATILEASVIVCFMRFSGLGSTSKSVGFLPLGASKWRWFHQLGFNTKSVANLEGPELLTSIPLENLRTRWIPSIHGWVISYVNLMHHYLGALLTWTVWYFTYIYIWLVVSIPLMKDHGVRQLGWWHSQYMGK